MNELESLMVRMDKLISTQKAEFKAECEKEREEEQKRLNRYMPRTDFDYEEEVRKANLDKVKREFLTDLKDIVFHRYNN